MKKGNKMILGYVLGAFFFIVFIPFVIYMSAVLIDQVFKIQIIPITYIRLILSILLIIIGFLFALWSLITQNVIGKGGPLEAGNIEISPKTKNLVISGPYKYTRNPMLFGTFLIYFGLAIYLNSITAVLLVLIFIAFMLIFVIRNEEDRLLKDFGSSYEEYRKKVSMIMPWFPKQQVR